MATPAQNIETLNRYFYAGGDLATGLVMPRAPYDAMGELASRAARDKAIRRALAEESILEKTLSPALLVPNRYVNPLIQSTLLEWVIRSSTGGLLWVADPSGITEWLGSEAGGRAYFIAALLSPARQVPGLDYRLELDPGVLGALLKIVIEVAIPASWFEGLHEQQVFDKLEVRLSVSGFTQAQRRALLALVGQARGRVVAELAKLATAKLDAFPAFPTGEGSLAPTPPPPRRPWWRSGWSWIGMGVGMGGGAMLAGRARR